jgi:dipeptidyl aminopeptidase/acylaminoacyl peptidase
MTAWCILRAPHADAQAKRVLQLEDLFRIRRIAEPALSPDGKWIVFTVTIPDKQANKNRSNLWIISSEGGIPRQLTTDSANEKGGAWSPDGKTIAFTSDRTGNSQVWLIDGDGSNERRFSLTSTESVQPVWSPDGKSIAYVSTVFPQFSGKAFMESDSLNNRKLDELQHGKVKAKIFTQLLYRHWDSWVDGMRKHILVQPVAGGDPKDITPGDTATPVPTREEAWSTNHDIYIVPAGGGTPRQITAHPAADGYPRYSPDGKYIAYRAQSVAAFEADRWQLMLYDRAAGTTRSLTDTYDRSVHIPVWSPDSKQLYFDAEDTATKPIVAVTLKGNDVRRIFDKHVNADINVSVDGKRLYFTQTSATRPIEVYGIGSDGRDLRPVTHMNDELLAEIDIPPPEVVWFEGEGGTKVHSWIFKPSGFDAKKRYPLVYFVHGGPQNSWLDAWGFRWNAALWAAQGYVLMAPNPRGSTGFGQRFVNEISNDWGGKVFVDLMKGLDYAEALPYIDKNTMAAAGASFGGYMMNWFQAKAGDRFKALVTHDGVYNFESMYGTTEEIWFDEWDHGKPWENPEEFNKYSPHKYAQNFRTPNLIIHSENDFRVPIGEGLQLFTALQRQGVPSKMLYFPDETHFVSKPLNSELWHKTVFDWLRTYIGQKPSHQ